MTHFSLYGGSRACLLVHGFGGKPEEMLPLGRFLHEQGFDVLGVELPGHGSDAANGRRVRWSDWFTTVEEGYAAIADRADSIFALGHSTGAILSLLLSASIPVRAVVCFAPISHLYPWQKRLILTGSKLIRSVPLPVLEDGGQKRLIPPYQWVPVPMLVELVHLLDSAPGKFSQVKTPVLILAGEQDKAVPPDSASRLASWLTCARVDCVSVKNAGHMLMSPAYRSEVWKRTLDFIRVN